MPWSPTCAHWAEASRRCPPRPRPPSRTRFSPASHPHRLPRPAEADTWSRGCGAPSSDGDGWLPPSLSPCSSHAPPPPTAGATENLGNARGVLGFVPLVPTALGAPDAVEVSVDRRLVLMSWTGGPDGVVRLDQWAAKLDGLFAKTAPGARFSNVGQDFALWFD